MEALKAKLQGLEEKATKAEAEKPKEEAKADAWLPSPSFHCSRKIRLSLMMLELIRFR